MEWIVETDAAAYGRRVLPWLQQDPIRNTVPATVLTARLDGTLPADGVWTAWLSDAGAVAAVALRTPPRGVLHTALPDGAAATLAAVVPAGLPGASGPVPDVRAFVHAYAARTRSRPALDHLVRLYRLDTLVPPPPVPGRLRPLTAAEVGLLERWSVAFTADAHTLDEPVPGLAARLIEQGRQLVWEVDGEPVCLVGHRRPVAGVPRIGPVYTPPEHRRRGYAAAAVAATCARLLEAGAAAVVLFADTANPTSTGVYVRLGFRPVADQEDWRLEY
ncbi:MAG TPA: GNAT family N-acetyltransferase [Mycobacteriales bacterium]|nr:GNAT family N-acetyltransferase [Mycobacteriales bacterium]